MPKYFEVIVGKVSKKNIPIDHPITWSVFNINMFIKILKKKYIEAKKLANKKEKKNYHL